MTLMVKQIIIQETTKDAVRKIRAHQMMSPNFCLLSAIIF